MLVIAKLGDSSVDGLRGVFCAEVATENLVYPLTNQPRRIGPPAAPLVQTQWRLKMNTFINNARLTLVLAVIVLLALTGASSLSAQESVVQISGTATDSSGAVVPGATVTVTSLDSQRVATTKTGNDGVYILRNLSPGRYL